MLKQQVVLEIKKDERIYQLHLPENCPLGEVHDVLYQMRSFIVNRINEAQKADEEAKKNVAPIQEQSKQE